MDMNGMSIRAGAGMNGMSIHAGARKDGALPCIAQNVRILLVDRDTTSLMILASQFEQLLYKVTTTESANVALALFEDRNNYYDIVIADISTQEMGISEFVEKLHNQRMTVPIILLAEEYFTMDIAKEALDRNVCYVMSKPPSQRDISNIWIHIRRVTGEMPVLSDKTNYIEIERNDGSRVGAAGNQKRSNLNSKLDNTDRESVKRKQKQIAEDPNSSNHAQLEEDGHNAKKQRLNWTPYLDDKFLQAINILGEHGARPKKILSLMDEPDLTPRHIASHLQKYRRQRKRSLNLQQIDSPVMLAVLPAAATLNNVVQGQTFGTASSPYAAAPNLVHCSFYGMKQDHYSFNYSGNNSVNTIINDGVHLPMGYSEGSYTVNAIINDGVQVPEGNGEGRYSVNAIINDGIRVPNANGGSNSFQAPIQEPEGARGRLINGLKAPNQEPKSKFGPGLCGLENAGDTGNMENDNLGEGSSDSNQEFGGMPSIDDMNQFMEDLETSNVDIWDWFK